MVSYFINETFRRAKVKLLRIFVSNQEIAFPYLKWGWQFRFRFIYLHQENLSRKKVITTYLSITIKRHTSHQIVRKIPFSKLNIVKAILNLHMIIIEVVEAGSKTDLSRV